MANEIMLTLTEKEFSLVKEAIIEFYDRRFPIERYIADRYATHTDGFKALKSESVSKRLQIVGDIITKIHNI